MKNRMVVRLLALHNAWQIACQHHTVLRSSPANTPVCVAGCLPAPQSAWQSRSQYHRVAHSALDRRHRIWRCTCPRHRVCGRALTRATEGTMLLLQLPQRAWPGGVHANAATGAALHFLVPQRTRQCIHRGHGGQHIFIVDTTKHKNMFTTTKDHTIGCLSV